MWLSAIGWSRIGAVCPTRHRPSTWRGADPLSRWSTALSAFVKPEGLIQILVPAASFAPARMLTRSFECSFELGPPHSSLNSELAIQRMNAEVRSVLALDCLRFSTGWDTELFAPSVADHFSLRLQASGT